MNSDNIKERGTCLFIGTLVVLISLLAISIIYDQTQRDSINKTNTANCKQAQIYNENDADYIFYKTNEIRAQNGLNELERLTELDTLARHKAYIFWEREREQLGSGWSANNPHDIAERTWLDIYNDCGLLQGQTIGENLSRKSLPVGRVVSCIPEFGECNEQSGGWMYSTTGHRENILNPKWKYIGVYSGHTGDGKAFPSTYHIQLFKE